MTKYVVGIVFDSTLQEVLLIRKTHPEWQAGRLNGIGGKVKKNETFYEAMVREAEEEAGISGLNWHLINHVSGSDYAIRFYYAVMSGSLVYEQTTDEELLTISTANLYHGKLDLIDPLRWMISCAYFEAAVHGE
jgi:8-oxo-dGTP diphosphatase